jgi:hypothetical protein
MRWPTSPGRDSRYPSDDFDINWPYGAYDTMGALEYAAPAGTIDELALPEALQDKRRRLGHLHQPFPPLTIWNWPTHPRWRYRRHERRALTAATVHWPTCREDLAAYTNRDVLEAEWDARFAWEARWVEDPPRHAGSAALVWCEANVTAVAAVAARSAGGCRVWATDILDEHHARIDLDATLRHITTHAHRLWRRHADTHLSLGPANTAEWDALIDMIDALDEYSRGLRGQTDTLVAYREILRLDDVDDGSIRLEFGLPLDDDGPLDRDAIDRAVKAQLDDLVSDLTTGPIPRLTTPH